MFRFEKCHALCTLLATTGKIIVTMLLRMTPSDLMKYLLVSCYFECHLLSYHSGSQVVPRKKVDYCNTLWYWTSHTITVNLFLSFLIHFSLSFTFLTYETFLTRVNQQQCFYPWQNTEGHKKGITRTWITGFPSMETAWVACVLCFWSQHIIFQNCFSLASIFHFAGKSKICTCNLRFHLSWVL